ncbi:MAG TPA: serine hydrolase domain-containing protein [Candidatus Binatia bacterium]|nr:serine hydrolase domain-containing protein [Candidatus Binatia bacterium]
MALTLPVLLTSAKPAVPLDGFVHPDFIPVADSLRRQLDGSPGGAAVCVYHEGEVVVDLWGGLRDATGSPWQRDTMSPSFSTTKGVAATVVHILADRRVIDYDARVADYWPEFAQAGKHAITVRHVLAHQSGLYHIRQMIDRADRMLDWEFMVRAIERATPVHEPGKRTGYHGLTFGYLVGELVRRATGRPFSQVVREEIAEPLALDGLYIGAPEDALERAAQLVWPGNGGSLASQLGWLRGRSREIGEVAEWSAGIVQRLLDLAGVELDLPSILDALAPRGIGEFDFGAQETLRAAIPAANGLFTARSLARMYACLAGGGAIDGVRLLSREALRRATEVQPPAASRVVIPFDMRWRLGYHGVFTTRGVPRHAFGHFGFGGSGAWADPSRDLAMALIVNSGLGTPFGDFRTARVSGVVLSCARERRAAARARRALTAALPPAAPATVATPVSRRTRAGVADGSDAAPDVAPERLAG